MVKTNNENLKPQRKSISRKNLRKSVSKPYEPSMLGVFVKERLHKVFCVTVVHKRI